MWVDADLAVTEMKEEVVAQGQDMAYGTLWKTRGHHLVVLF